MNTGTIVWYNEKQGFGFIVDDAGGNQLYFSVSQRDILSIGQKVTFDIKINPRNGRNMLLMLCRKS